MRDRGRRELFAILTVLTGWSAPLSWMIPMLDAIEPISRPRSALRIYLIAHVLTVVGIPVLLAVGSTATIFWIEMCARRDPRRGVAFGTVLVWGVLCTVATMNPKHWILVD